MINDTIYLLNVKISKLIVSQYNEIYADIDPCLLRESRITKYELG